MNLHTLKPAAGAKKDKVRLGRGIGSGMGKTCGRGHKGQRARAGGFHKVGFEGGQMPIQRRLPKFGFASRIAYKNAEVNFTRLENFTGTEVTVDSLKEAGLVKRRASNVKIIASGSLTKAFTFKGVKVTVGARKVIESVGGKIEE